MDDKGGKIRASHGDDGRHDVGPRKGELLNLEWSDVDLRRRVHVTANQECEIRVILRRPVVYEVFMELWKERRLDTTRVFLYKEKVLQRIGTGF